MAIAVVADFDGMTERQYQQVMWRLRVGRMALPGLLAHIAGSTPEGWRVVQVWETPEAFDDFVRHGLGDAMHDLGVAMPGMRIFPAQDLLLPALPDPAP